MPQFTRLLLIRLALLLLLSAFIIAPVAFTTNAQHRIVLPRNPSFSKTDLQVSDGGNTLSLPDFPTTLQFGPDNRLYVATHKGHIFAYTVARNTETNTYYIQSTEEISHIRTIPNHNDDGTSFIAASNERQVTGILVVGTAENPVIYVTSSDARTNNNNSGGTIGDINLDTNSGIITRLTYLAPNTWDMVHLVRGLPRSEEYHSTNGMALDTVTNTLYVTSGGHTNMGGPGVDFAFTPEYALSGALLSVDLNAIDGLPLKLDTASNQQYLYDLPTLDDPTRGTPGQLDPGDPFGGNDGLNQAMIVPDGPVQVYSPGYRNIYDVVLTENTRRLYVFDNGPNAGWGGSVIINESNPLPNGYPNCNNSTTDEGTSSTYYDQLHYIPAKGYYGGHVNPTRANPQNAKLYRYVDGQAEAQVYEFTQNWSPVPFGLENPIECEYRSSGTGQNTTIAADGSLTRINGSTNGLAEYTASNFEGALKGDLLAATYQNNSIFRLKLNAEGNAVTVRDGSLMSQFGIRPLDVVAQGDNNIFPGTIWAVSYVSKKITAFDPAGFDVCYDNTAVDADGDGYTNADEVAANANPCSGASVPSDRDGDLVSDFNDTDDDNDNILDLNDAFAIDSSNGMNLTLPFNYPFFDNSPATGFYGIGFTGLMTNVSTDYLMMFDDNNLTAGGAAGAFTIDEVSAGDATGALNTQQNAFQFGINVSSSSTPFSVESRMVSPFFNGSAPVNGQSQGIYIGSGDQDNYLKIALDANNGIRVTREENGTITTSVTFDAGDMLSADFLDMGFIVDTNASTAQPRIRTNNQGWLSLGTPISIPAAWLNPDDGKGLALGLIATSGASGVSFPATWDYFAAEHVTIPPTATPTNPPESTATNTATSVPNATTTPAPTPTENGGVEMLVNGDFEDTTLNPWQLKFGTGDKLKCNKLDKTVAYEGLCAFRFKGGAGEASKLEQTLDTSTLTFNAGDTVTLSGVVSAKNETASGKIKVKIKYSDGTPTGKISVGLGQTAGYEPFSQPTGIASGSVSKIKIGITHRSVSGKVYIDALSLKLTNTTMGLLPLPN